MMVDECLEQALHSAEPVDQLRSLVLRLLSQGQDKATVLERLEQMRRQLREADREADEDAVMDVMDFLLGWCSPHMRLPPDDQETLGEDQEGRFDR
jgi:hypothetical protein